MENTEIKTVMPEVVDYKEAEWCFQFGETDEPVVFAWSNDDQDPGEVKITLKANSISNVLFVSKDGTKAFKLFARPITEETRAVREEMKNK
jgi:hypothetical protein